MKEGLSAESKNREEELSKEVANTRQLAEREKNLRQENEQEHESEIAKVKIEYESKMRRLQAQTTKLQNKAQNVAGNDIFRKKLQHERESSSKIIADLRAEVSELKDRLSKSTSDSFIAGYSRHIANSKQRTLGPTTKRRKT